MTLLMILNHNGGFSEALNVGLRQFQGPVHGEIYLQVIQVV